MIDTNKLLDSVTPYTVQLFLLKTEVEPVEFRPHASGVLLTYDNQYFLLSAAHVFLGLDSKHICVFINGMIYTLESDIICTDINKNEEHDIFDIAVCRLGVDTVCDLSKAYRFLDVNNVSMGHKLCNESKYLVFGYPEVTTTIDYEKNIFSPISFFYLTQACLDIKKHRRLGLDSLCCSVILVDFSLKKSIYLDSGKRCIAPRPEGISGCGLWHLDNDKLCLVGIMTQWNNKESVMYAIPIDYFIRCIIENIRNDFALSRLAKQLNRMF